jgi:hypothetical protein
MAKGESPVQVARRHVSEAENRVARQERLVQTLERDRHFGMVPHARKICDVLKQSLHLARVHLQLEIEHYGDDTPAPVTKSETKDQ